MKIIQRGCIKLHGGGVVNYNPNNTYTINLNNKEENTNVFSKKNGFKEVVDCWNEHNGKRLGKVNSLTHKRFTSIKKQLEEHEITYQQLMTFFKTLPYADKWLYNPDKRHKNWRPDFDWWMANTNGWLTKALEGKVHTENPQAFSLIMNGQDAPYSPMCGGALNWNDYYKCYLYMGMVWDKIPDGYTDETRPDGASIMLNNGRGFIKWNRQTRKWEKDNSRKVMI